MIHIAIAFTPDYFVPAATTLHSLFRNADRQQRYMVHCLESTEIPQRQKDRLQDMLGCVAVSYIKVNSLPAGTTVNERYSAAALFRLMLPDLLPDIGRILYLDCDIIVRRDISRTYLDTDLSGSLLAAVSEPAIEDQRVKRLDMGLDPDSYFNSGFLLLNLEMMRRENASASFFKLLKDDRLEFPDQDVLNLVCKDRVTYLPPSCNSIRTFFIGKYRQAFLSHYNRQELEDVMSNGNVHYTGGKPWRMFTVMFAVWWKEYRALPAEIRQEWKVSKRLLSLSYLGNGILETARKIKGRILQ